MCTSKNGDRSLWIDYIFHDASLAPMDRSDVSAPAGAIPDLVHPSDHLPLACTFRFFLTIAVILASDFTRDRRMA